MTRTGLPRRNVLKLMGAAPVVAPVVSPAWADGGEIFLLREKAGPAAAPAVGRAAGKLAAALAAHGAKLTHISDRGPGEGHDRDCARRRLRRWRTPFPPPPPAGPGPMPCGWCRARATACCCRRWTRAGSSMACMNWPSGWRSAVPPRCMLKDRVEETPPNRVRSIARPFLSEIEDKAWFYDRQGWQEYLDMLVAARFNRFNFALGFGYDFPKGVTGDYLHFPYPYLVDVPGYRRHHHARRWRRASARRISTP